MSDALEDHRGSVNIGCRIFINFHFADGVIANAEEGEAADDIATSMDKTFTRYKIEIGSDKTLSQMLKRKKQLMTLQSVWIKPVQGTGLRLDLTRHYCKC